MGTANRREAIGVRRGPDASALDLDSQSPVQSGLSVTSGLRHQCDVSVFLGQLNPHDNFFLRLVVNGRIGDDLIDALRGHYIANVASGCRYVRYALIRVKGNLLRTDDGSGKNTSSQPMTHSFSASFASAASFDIDTFLVSTLAPK